MIIRSFCHFLKHSADIEAWSKQRFSPNRQSWVVIPVGIIGQEVGPDMEDVARLSSSAWKRLLNATVNSLCGYAIGFTPGFRFLGNTPRWTACTKKTTTIKSTHWSWGHCGNPTAVYPVWQGGWQYWPAPLIWLIGAVKTSPWLRGDSVRLSQFLEMSS